MQCIGPRSTGQIKYTFDHYAFQCLSYAPDYLSWKQGMHVYEHILPFLAHLAFRPCELLSSLFVRRLSSVVRPSTFHILIFSSETTGPIATKFWWNGLCIKIFWNQLLNWNQTLITQSLDGPLLKLCLVVPPTDQDGCTAELKLTQDPMGNSHKNQLVWNQQLSQNQTLMEQSLDGPFPKLCPAVALSHQDGCHSAVSLLQKATLIQVSDYRLLGASGCISTCVVVSVILCQGRF